MARTLIAPNKYIQGAGELKNLRSHIEHLGEKFFVVISENGYKRFGEEIEGSFGGKENLEFEYFNGECSMNEINRIRDVFQEGEYDGLIGVGGGKIHDTVKAVAHYEEKPYVVIPTIASTDAPTSGVSVIYTDDGVVESYLVVRNPDVVLLDLQAIANAPTRLLVAGMGDALATKFEARSTRESDALTMAGGKPLRTGTELANLCYDMLIEQGLKAKLAVDNNTVTKAVEEIVEANTLISGLGFESGGLAAAHAIHDGFTAIKETDEMYHGEKVAFGTLVHLVLENAPMEEIMELIAFCHEVGLPTTLEDLNIKEVKEEEIREVAKIACNEGSTIYNMPFEINEDEVYAAIMTADALGREFS